MNKRQDRGITLIVLIITIVILLILTATVIYSIEPSKGVSTYNNMCADIRLLEDKILVYYNKYEDIPKLGTARQINGEDYYEIDLERLENLTLNYGIKKDGNSADIYLVNYNLKVYYLEGVEKLDKVYHTDE